MILQFPDLGALRLALSSNTVPTAVSLAPVVAAVGEDGQVWLDTDAPLAKNVKAALKKFGVGSPSDAPVPLDLRLENWLQLFPVQRTAEVATPHDQTPVLFVLPAEGLSSLVNEILRLGNDRQSFRFLEDDKGDRVLLRVVGPPYYSLLRALDSLPVGRNGQSAAPLAFVEANPRLWVQIGYSHPFAGQVKVPEKEVILLQPPRQWTHIADAPFRDIYDVLEFSLPEQPTAFAETDLDHKLPVKLRLERGDATEPAELWVLRGKGKESPVDQLDNLVSNADDDLLRQLSFAVAEKDGQTIIVLRARPGKHAQPPVLVLQGAVAFRSYLRLPNLFVPVGTRVHPPLRRDAVRKLLADDPGELTWLLPGDAVKLAGSFTPETLPDTAFRPLPDWIDYVLDHDREALQGWVQAMHFEFESFVCNEEATPKPKKPPSEREKPPRQIRSRDSDDVTDVPPPPETVRGQRPPTDSTAEFLELARIKPNELKIRLTEMEKKFAGVEGQLDHPERLKLWPELANLNAALGNGEEAGLCWINALWFEAKPPADLVWAWFQAEASRVPLPMAARGKQPTTWCSAASTAVGDRREVSGRDLDRLLDLSDVSAPDVRALAAYLFWSGLQPHPSADLVARLVPVRQFLEAHEREAPVRGVWLAWLSLVRLSGGDTLALARARDRLLERLFEQGLRAEQDLPGFLRFSGAPSSERFRDFREWLLALPEVSQRWIASLPRDSGAKLLATEGYADLIFSFGLARLGEGGAARKLLERAKETLPDRDDVHTVLLEAFVYRIETVLAGQPHRGPLPVEQLEYLEAMKADAKYCVDRLRQASRILEPEQEINAYGDWTKRTSEVAQAVSELDRTHDPVKIQPLVTKLLHQFGKGTSGAANKAHILREALNVAPRVGEEFAVYLLGQTSQTFDQLPEPVDRFSLEEQARLLEKGLNVAGHFDRREHVQLLMTRFQKLLNSRKGPESVAALERLAGQCFRGLRKLGMREEIDLLLKQMSDVVLESQKYTSIRQFQTAAEKNDPAVRDKNWLAALRVLLRLAGEWFYFGRDKQAEPALDAARSLLFSEPGLLDQQTHLATEQTDLACAYIRAVAQVPVPRVAQVRLDELLKKLKVRDMFMTSTYYKISQLRVLEALVLAVLTDDFTLGGDVRRWLDEDEFLVRRRVHRDVRSLVPQTAH